MHSPAMQSAGVSRLWTVLVPTFLLTLMLCLAIRVTETASIIGSHNYSAISFTAPPLPLRNRRLAPPPVR
jgi:hypothetical protein